MPTWPRPHGRSTECFTAPKLMASREFMDHVKDIPVEADRGSVSGRALLEGRVVHIPDVKADPEYTLVEAQRLGGYRTALGVPMLREGVPIGCFVADTIRSQAIH